MTEKLENACIHFEIELNSWILDIMVYYYRLYRPHARNFLVCFCIANSTTAFMMIFLCSFYIHLIDANPIMFSIQNCYK